MKKSMKIIKWILIVMIGSGVIGCGTTNHLREYSFRDRTMVADMLTPPRPQVFTDSYSWFDQDDPVGSVLRVGTTIVKEVEASKTQARMDSALQKVDVPERIKSRALQRCAKILKYRPINDTDKAEFILDMEIRNYGIDAKSWSAGTYFKIDMLVKIIDNESRALIWKRKIKEKQPISPEIFGLGNAAENVISAVALSRLSVDEIATGFQHLADYTADRIAVRLQKDFVKAQR